jgi:DNA-binding NarL/FixJ family response regulator
VWEASGARLDLAQCLIRSNRHAEAAGLIATVHALAVGLGSDPLLSRAEELNRLVRSRGSLDEPWYPLSVREFEVARLIAQGLTNGAIAEELYVAPKTVSAHVEHILAKLGVARRTEVAAWVATVSPPDRPRYDAGVEAISRP